MEGGGGGSHKKRMNVRYAMPLNGVQKLLLVGHTPHGSCAHQCTRYSSRTGNPKTEEVRYKDTDTNKVQTNTARNISVVATLPLFDLFFDGLLHVCRCKGDIHSLRHALSWTVVPGTMSFRDRMGKTRMDVCRLSAARHVPLLAYTSPGTR